MTAFFPCFVYVKTRKKNFFLFFLLKKEIKKKKYKNI